MHVRSSIEGNIIVFNIGNLNSFVAGKFVKLCLDILERSFYGLTERIYFFNTGTGMDYTINTLKSSLHPVTKELVTVVSNLNKEEALDHIGAHNLPVDLGGTYIKGYKCPWPTATPPIKGERITLSILKKKNIQPFYFCEDEFREEWEDTRSVDDLTSIFSEHIVTRSRLKTSRPIEEEGKGRSNFLVFLDRYFGFNCCTNRYDQD